MDNIEKAVFKFLQMAANGWDIQTALRCCHDTVFDEISLAAFTDKCLLAVNAMRETQNNNL